jgi:membrane-bound serine protease (ClpP class)
MMRATAEYRGRNPDIAEAMVGKPMNNDTGYAVGNVLTLTRDEAAVKGFCDGFAENTNELLQKEGYADYTIVEPEFSWIDKIINFLINPFVHGILILLILGGIYFEMQHPGIGFPLAVAITAAILFFAPLYLEKLAASWEILVFIAGLLLLGLEVFVIPGFGLAGISGIVLILAGLILSLLRNIYFDFTFVSGISILQAFIVVISSFVATFVIIFSTGGLLMKSRLFQRLVLQDSLPKPEYRPAGPGPDMLQNLKGKTGIAFTDLHPAGKIEVEGAVYDALSESEFISKNSNIIVLQDYGNRIVVRKI